MGCGRGSLGLKFIFSLGNEADLYVLRSPEHSHLIFSEIFHPISVIQGS